MQLTIEAVGIDVVKGDLAKLKQAPRNKQLWSKAAQVLRKESMECFKGQRAPDGTPWQKLSQGSLMSRAYQRTRSHRKRLKRMAGYKSKTFQRVMGSAKILEDTGKLRGSVATEFDNSSARVGSNLIYAKTHQFGCRKRNIPARPFIGLSPQGRKLVLEVMQKHLEEATQ
jgi:phage virion morphogenesis protein